MTDSRANLEKQLEAVEAFIASPAYGSYLHTNKTDLAVIEEQILTQPPTPDTLSPLNQLHGQRTTLLANLNFFEESRRSFKGRIEVLLDEENNSATNKQ